jgi:hypothetical protein
MLAERGAGAFGVRVKIGAPGAPITVTPSADASGTDLPGSGVVGITGPPELPGSGVVGMTGAADDAATAAGVTSCAPGCASVVPEVIFSVGASPFWPAESRAPHPPQNREFGSFWVPQLGQRIPAQG